MIAPDYLHRAVLMLAATVTGRFSVQHLAVAGGTRFPCRGRAHDRESMAPFRFRRAGGSRATGSAATCANP